MNSAQHLGISLSLEEAAELECVSYQALKKRLKRSRTRLQDDGEDGRRKLVPLTALSSNAYARWLAKQSAVALAPLQPIAATSEPPTLFHPQTETERGLLAAMPPAIPEHQRPYIERWALILAQTRNGTWLKYRGQTFGEVLVRNQRDFLRGLANVHAVSASTIYAKKSLLCDVECDVAVPDGAKFSEFWKRAFPKPRPGRSGHTFFADPENSWALFALRGFYLGQAKLSVKRAHELLCLEIDAKQRAFGINHLYQKPTLKQCRTALEKIDVPSLVLGREGEKAYNDRCAPFISRRPPEHANDVWVTDQRESNVRLRDGGNRLGRIWAVNFLDVSSWRWLGCMFGPVLNSDVVMAAAAMSLSRAGVPRAVHQDLGKEFRGKRFLGGTFTIRGEVLFGDAVGLWERLKVQVVEAIGRNPQSKIIERWHHELDRFDQELPGWCGSNPDERPEKLAQEEAAHHKWLQTGQGSSPLLGIPEYIAHYLDFCESRWNAGHRGRGKYLQGMTPNEAWNTRLDKASHRTLTAEEVELHCADHRTLQVARGGQVNVTFNGQTIEYTHPELFARQGEEVEVIVPRLSLRRVSVIYRVPGGTASCVAERKKLHDWLPEDRDELKEALRCRAALKRAVKRGICAQRALAEARTLRELPSAAAEIAPEITASFAPPGPRPEREISGSQWMMRNRGLRKETMTSEEVADKMLASLRGTQ